MARLTQDCVEQVRQASDIVDVVGEYVRLQGRDPQFMCICPFHQDTKPSVSVRRDRQFFYCFGCQKKGDVFTFVQEIENLDFTGAVEHLARRAGVPLVYQEGRPALERDPNQLKVLEWTAQLFERTLRGAPESDPGRRILAERGIGPDEIERFRIGLDPDWQTVVDAARRDGFGEEQLLKAGVAARSDRTGSLYDRFHHRLIFPIADVQGRVVGFGGRRLDDEEESPKYINSPDSPLFHKSILLYAAHLVRPVVADTKQVVVAEGYTDVIALHRAGIREALAPMGTALGRDHLRAFRQLRGLERVVVLFDGDTAGTTRAGDVVRELVEGEFPLRVGLLPEGLDPDDMVRAGRADELRACVDKAVDGVEFVLDRAVRAHGPSDRHERLAVLRELSPLMERIASPALRMGYTGLFAERLGLERSAVEAELHRIGRHAARPTRRAERRAEQPATPATPLSQVHLGLIRALLFAHEVADAPAGSYWSAGRGLRLLELVTPAVNADSRDPQDQCLAELYRLRREGAGADAGALAVERRELAEVLSAASVAEELPADLERYVEQTVERLLRSLQEAKRAALRAEMQRTRPLEDGGQSLSTYEKLVAAGNRPKGEWTEDRLERIRKNIESRSGKKD